MSNETKMVIWMLPYKPTEKHLKWFQQRNCELKVVHHTAEISIDGRTLWVRACSASGYKKIHAVVADLELQVAADFLEFAKQSGTFLWTPELQQNVDGSQPWWTGRFERIVEVKRITYVVGVPGKPD